MRPLRIFFCLFSGCASLVALAHHLGLDLWACASCSFVEAIPLRAALVWGGPVALFALAYGLYTDRRGARVLLGAAAAGSASLAWWMVHNNTICPVCMLVHIGVLAAALSLVPRPRAISPVFFSVAVIFAATGGWDKFGTEQGVAIFRPRDNEAIPTGPVYVLFTDPQCPRCAMVEDQLAKRVPPLQVLYRWTLLPHDTYHSIRACALLEMARAQGPEPFERLRGELHKMAPPFTDPVLLEAAANAALGARARYWLDHPDEAALIAIAADQTTAEELRIQSLPALAALSPADPTGLRRLRLVPFSEIGIRR